MEIVYLALQEMYSLRQQCKTLFSFRHFAALFKSACDHFSTTITTPFSFIKASRLQVPVAPKLSQRIAEFLQKLNSSYPIDSAISVIASSILLDSNPPGMHSNQHALLVFLINPRDFFYVVIPFAKTIKPPTAGIRLLCVDGGGVWGVLPLPALQQIKNHVAELAGFHLPIQDSFDMAYGTSSEGGLIAFGQFINGCRYKAQGQKNALQEAFGISENLFGHCGNYTSRTMVAVTATTTGDTAACLSTNCDGPGTRSDQCALIRVPIGVVSRQFQVDCCVQSCKMYLCCPMGLRKIWLESQGITDMVLALGTGSSNSNAKATGRQGIWRDGFISCLYRSFMSFLDAWCQWYFRCNMGFSTTEPEIDDLKAMHLLNNASVNQVGCATKIRIAESLIANTFCFELDGLLAYTKGQYECLGYISCRLNMIPQKMLLKKITSQTAFFLAGARL
ncbi:hypothetical protein C7212DRAFT_348466 [Tuber magnatum]|uniref:FabD/lysophospholipase-like protein n=1 Tax=Tuber magnatum TaxID=42249 RepID=A0A317SDX0_9PEZI|nr:hypothetical protein C7212DRAFT_348466 [Tuber magnatum]